VRRLPWILAGFYLAGHPGVDFIHPYQSGSARKSGPVRLRLAGFGGWPRAWFRVPERRSVEARCAWICRGVSIDPRSLWVHWRSRGVFLSQSDRCGRCWSRGRHVWFSGGLARQTERR